MNMKKSKQNLNIGYKDKLILLLRDPFDAISMHLLLYELMKSSTTDTKMDAKVLEISTFWCNEEMFIPLNVRNEARKWKMIIEYVLNDYLMNIGSQNVLMLQLEDMTFKSSDLNDQLQTDENEERLLTILEEYFKIANFIFNGDDLKVNENKFSWITKIICELESNKKLMLSMNIPIENNANDKLNCDIWNVVQNYASLYQYFPSTYNCI